MAPRKGKTKLETGTVGADQSDSSDSSYRPGSQKKKSSKAKAKKTSETSIKPKKSEAKSSDKKDSTKTRRSISLGNEAKRKGGSVEPKLNEESFNIETEVQKGKNTKGGLKKRIEKVSREIKTVEKKAPQKSVESVADGSGTKNKGIAKSDEIVVKEGDKRGHGERLFKMRKHIPCIKGAERLLNYLKSKVQLKDTNCDLSFLPKTGEVVETNVHKYKVLSLISRSCFGGIFEVQDIESGKVYALQAAIKDGFEELNIICSIVGQIQSHHFCKRIDSGRILQKYNFIILTLGEQNVSDLVQEKRPLSIQTAVAICKQTLNGIFDLHQFGRLHRNIKASNFVFTKVNKHQVILLVGLGMSEKICQGSKNRQPLVNELIGTLKNSSLAALTGQQLTFRDEYESWFFMICGFFGARLPWEDNENLCEVVQMKENLHRGIHGVKEQITSQLPVELQRVFNYILFLDENELPNLEYIHQSLNSLLKVNGIKNPYYVDWDSETPYVELPSPTTKTAKPQENVGFYKFGKKAVIHFNLIFNNEIHHFNQICPSQKRTNRNKEKIAEFRCAVNGCGRRIQVTGYSDNAVKDGDKAKGLHVISGHTCVKPILFDDGKKKE
uniref:Protein kinase domain-containing protein n=1 Tax=Panagrolaimus sp. ES5 TaxID=591445 RepID=A0AC34FT93_9BILA